MQAARLIGCDRRTLRKEAACGKITVTQYGPYSFYSSSAIAHYVAQKGAQPGLAPRESLLTTVEAARLSGCTRQNILRAVKKGQIRPVEYGGPYYLFTAEEIQVFLSRRKNG